MAKTHHRSRELSQLVDHPPRDDLGTPCTICVNEYRIPEGGWGDGGLGIE